MAFYSAFILAEALEQLSALREMRLDLHERGARRRPDGADFAVPAIVSDDQITQLRAAGYRVEIQDNLQDVAAGRAADVMPQANRFASGALDRAADQSTPERDMSAARGNLEQLMDLSNLEEEADPVRGARSVLGGYLNPDEVESALHTLAATYPDSASVSPLPERSWEGRTTHVLQLHAGRQHPRPGVLIIGTTSDASQFTYKGPEAFLEPEARNVRFLLERHDHIGYYVDVHSHGELILYGWGDDENQHDAPVQSFLNPPFDGVRGKVGDAAYREFMDSEDQSALTDVAHTMNAALNAVGGRSYTVDQAVGLYPTSATADDYAFSRHRVDSARRKIYSFTIEFGQQFVPPYTEMRRIMADVAAGLTELCRRVVKG